MKTNQGYAADRGGKGRAATPWAMGLALAVSLLTAVTGVEARSPQAPLPLRGVWFGDSDMGRHLCLQYKLRQHGEHVAGALLITDTQIIEMRDQAEDQVLFVTKAVPAAEAAWQIQALSDVYPYTEAKKLLTFSLSTRRGKLYWSSKVESDGQEAVQTQVYERCV